MASSDAAHTWNSALRASAGVDPAAEAAPLKWAPRGGGGGELNAPGSTPAGVLGVLMAPPLLLPLLPGEVAATLAMAAAAASVGAHTTQVSAAMPTPSTSKSCGGWPAVPGRPMRNFRPPDASTCADPINTPHPSMLIKNETFGTIFPWAFSEERKSVGLRAEMSAPTV
jgi:hypothetical protein